MRSGGVVLTALFLTLVGTAAPARADGVIDTLGVIESATAYCDQISTQLATFVPDVEASIGDATVEAERKRLRELHQILRDIQAAIAPECVVLDDDWDWATANLATMMRCEADDWPGSTCSELRRELDRRGGSKEAKVAELKRTKQTVLDAMTEVLAMVGAWVGAEPDEVSEASEDYDDEPAPPADEVAPPPAEPAVTPAAPTEVATAEPTPTAAPEVVHHDADDGPSLGERLAPLRPQFLALGLGHVSGALPEQTTWTAAASAARRPWRAEPDFALGYELRGVAAPSWAHGSARVEAGLAWLGCLCAVAGVEGSGGDGGPALPAAVTVGGALRALLPIGDTTGLDLGGQVLWRLGDGERAVDLSSTLLLGIDGVSAWTVGFVYTSLDAGASLWTLTLGRARVSLDS